MSVRFSATFGQLFLVLAHLLFKLLNDAVQRDDHVGAVIGCKKIIRLFGGYAKFNQRGFVVLQIDDDPNRGRSIEESRQALHLVANSLLNGVTQVTVLG